MCDIVCWSLLLVSVAEIVSLNIINRNLYCNQRELAVVWSSLVCWSLLFVFVVSFVGCLLLFRVFFFLVL